MKPNVRTPSVRTAATLILGAALGIASASMLNHPARAADEKQEDRKQRLEHGDWTNADYARDALDHVKTAEQEMLKLTESDKSKAAKEATDSLADSRNRIDKYIAEVDARSKKK